MSGHLCPKNWDLGKKLPFEPQSNYYLLVYTIFGNFSHCFLSSA